MGKRELSGATVTILATGGTIEKKYDPIKEVFLFEEKDCLSKFLSECQFEPNEYVRALKKDSLNMRDVDRASIMSKLDEIHGDRVVVVHGTSTLVDTAQYLNKIEGLPEEKTIVMTGSLFPSQLKVPETAFNLGLAVAAAQILPYGIYVAMHGKIAKTGDIAKNGTTGIFEFI